MPKILFPTDFSKNARNAFIYAINIAKKTNTGITSIHIYEKPHISGIERMPATGKEIIESIKLEIFEEYKEQIREYRQIASEMNAGNISIKHELIEGETTKSIIRYAKDHDVDFIVMGTKGASGLKELFLGSNTAEIMEKAPCPVLGIPENARHKQIKKIGVTYNFEKDSPQMVEQALKFAAYFDASIDCIHVDTTGNEEKESLLKEKFDHQDHINCVVIDNQDIESALVEYSKTHDIDIITMVMRKRSFFQKLFYLSIAKKMAFHTEVPILALPQSIL